MPKSIISEAIEAIEQGVPFALGMITGVKGASPQKDGSKALYMADGRVVGTVGGGCLEAEIQKRALEAIRTGKAAQFELDLDHDIGCDHGLICGGRVSCLLVPNPVEALPIFRELAPRKSSRTWGVTKECKIVLCEEGATGLLYRETVLPQEQLWIAGAGQVARAVAALAELVDFEVTVFEDQGALADPSYFPAGTKLRVGNWGELLTEELPRLPTLGLILTRRHQHDSVALSKWVHMPFAFLGMMGSRRRRKVLFDQFVAEGIATKEQLERVVCPVGLAIGDVTVQEIALSITAQLVQNRSERRISQQVARNIKSPSLIKARAA